MNELKQTNIGKNIDGGVERFHQPNLAIFAEE